MTAPSRPGRLRALISDLALLPRIWRHLVAQARDELAWERRVADGAAQHAADPAYQARRAARAAKRNGISPFEVVR